MPLSIDSQTFESLVFSSNNQSPSQLPTIYDINTTVPSVDIQSPRYLQSFADDFHIPSRSIPTTILLYGLKPLLLRNYIVFHDSLDQQWNQSPTTLASVRITSRLIPAIVSYIPATTICSESPLLVNQGVYVLCPTAPTMRFAYRGIH
eukprot:jgi/Psemu1/16415/gm1.16415_g